MPVELPKPPTPPTPPTIPKITLGGAGSVTESTTPQDSSQTDEQHNEALARQAVANGDGPLSKTTQSKPQAKQQQAQQNQQPQNGKQGQTTAQTSGSRELDPQTAALLQDGQDQQGKEQQSQTQAPRPGDYSHGYSGLYWGVSILVMFVLGFVLLRKFLHRRKGREGLSLADFTHSEPQTLRDYDGMRPDEVLAQLSDEQAQEEADEEAARALLARAKLRAAANKPVPEPAAPKAARPAVPARQLHTYAEQPDLPQDKTVVDKRPLPEREDGHFEVRV